MKTGKEILAEYNNQPAILKGSLSAFKTLEEMIDEALNETWNKALEEAQKIIKQFKFK